jgi:hypothetical protein
MKFARPKVFKERGRGTWGVWFGPGPALRSFETWNEAIAYVLGVATLKRVGAVSLSTELL